MQIVGLTVLGGLAEFERSLILQRTSEDRSRARARGVKMGRKPKLTIHQQREAVERRAAGETLSAIARSFNTSHVTVIRTLNNAAAMGA
jgi:DNA invertase Pin-like site-specific DNA recombinase